jgi:hypothetical protein
VDKCTEFKACRITKTNTPEYGDSVPSPSEFGCKSYWYIEWVFVPEEERRKGEATRLITEFCNRKKLPILVYLLGGKDHHGTSLEPLFKKLGFKPIARSRIAIDMFRPAKSLRLIKPRKRL